MTRSQFKEVVLVPVLAWAALCAILLATALYAFWPQGHLKAAVGPIFALCKALIIAIVFMRLDRSSAMIRFAAVTGLLWLSILFTLTLADYFTRAALF